MIWYWKIDIVLKRYLIRFDGFWIDDFRLAENWWKFCFWRYPWSIAEISDGDGYGYGSTVSLWRAKHWKDNCFYFLENHPELDQFYLALNRTSKLKVDWNQLNSSDCLWEFNWFHCTGGWRTSTGNTVHLQDNVEDLLDVTFVCVYRVEWMTSRKGVWKFVSLAGLQLGFGASCHSLSIW